MMKKILAVLLAALMLLTLAACGNKDVKDEDGDTVINLGVQILTEPAPNGGTFTYDYLSSTTVVITDFTGNDEPHELVIPATIDGKTVAAIGEEAFYACSNIASLVLPEGLTTIGAYAFANCEVLTTVSFPSTLTTVEKGAFYSCDTLSELKLGATALKTVGDNAFADCVALTGVTFPSTLTAVGDIAFLNCTALESITLPEGVSEVGAQAFYNCTAVTSLTLPASLETIGSWAFNPMARDLADEALVLPAGSYAEEHINTFRK